MFKLIEYKSKDSPIESSFDPGQGLYVIGRDSRSNKVLNSQYISRIHCQLVSSGEDWILYDGNPNEAGYKTPRHSAAPTSRPAVTRQVHASSNTGDDVFDPMDKDIPF